MNQFINNIGFAWKGIKKAFSEQRNLRFHFSAALAVVAAGFYFEITAEEWMALVLTIGLVVTLELLNTAVEGLVDLVSPQHQPLAGKIKDIAAGAVLIAAITSIIIGFLIFHKYVFNWVHSL